MFRHLCYWFALLPTWAMAYDSVTFITSQDTFTVNKSAQRFTIEGKPVAGNLLERLEPVLTGPVANDCPKLNSKPTLTALVVTGNQSEKREFFVKQGLLRIGNKCLTVEGEGLFYLPLHRSWIIGPFHDGLKLNSPLKVENGGAVMASLVKNDGEWMDTHEKSELDWDFFSRFEQSLLDYRITFRIQPEAAAGKPTVAISSGSEKIKFAQLSPKVWALMRPGAKQLEVSSDWGFWFDLDQAVWRDRHAADFEKIEAGGNLESRIALMKDLDSALWTHSLELFYQRRLRDPKEDLQIRVVALGRLKTKPSWRNIRAEMQALQSDPPDDLLNLLTLALRARNSRGPIYETGATDRAVVIRTWTDWWKENSGRKD